MLLARAIIDARCDVCAFAQLEHAETLGHVNSLPPPFSAIQRDAAVEIAWCERHGTGVIVHTPAQSGLLARSFTRERAAAPPDDRCSRSPKLSGNSVGRNPALADALRPIAERHGTSVAALAVARTLAWPGVTGAIVGRGSPEQVDGPIGAANLVLTPQDLHEIAAAIERPGAGTGPVRSADAATRDTVVSRE